MSHFDYAQAFSRNIGWVTDREQILLRNKRIAIGGMGGVGGSHLLTLTRLGIGHFHIADFDRFELANFNRQAGASISTLERPKVDVMAEAALDINPQLQIARFPQGVTKENIGQFLANVDLYIDGLDFFAVDARRMVFAKCNELAIPAITAAPLGMGTALLNFIPGKMSFEDYFCMDGLTEEQQLLNFLIGLSPAMLQRTYLADPSTVDLHRHRGPSTPMACELCAGLAATEALKILLERGAVRAAPHGLHFDAYRNKLSHTWRPWGNRNPLQWLALQIIKRKLNSGDHESPKKIPRYNSTDRTSIEAILELARWAPSGDNTQPWRFEILSPSRVRVYGHDTRDHCVYDLHGHASQLSLGILLETIVIAASSQGLRCEIHRLRHLPDTTPTFEVDLIPAPEVHHDPLAAFIPVRTVQRRAMKSRPLTPRERHMLENALPVGFSLIWIDGWRQKFTAARLLFRNAGLRLTLPEAYQTHSTIIEWNARYSEDRIPDQALGTDMVTTHLMRWALQSWKRIAFLNRYLAGTVMPRLQLDLIPALACAGHFVILAERPVATLDERITAGRAIQRFWLTATRAGLHIQPEMTPLIFHGYIRDGVSFSTDKKMLRKGRHVSTQLEQLIGADAATRAVFMGRIGVAPEPTARSLRLPLDRLIVKDKNQH